MKRRVLYTEGDSNLRRSTTSMLERNGYKVHSFEKWEPALDNYHRRIYDICIFGESATDSNLNNLTTTVRHLDPIQPIIVLTTSEDSTKNRVEAFSAGADVLLGKYDNEQELLLRIENLLKHMSRAKNTVDYKYKIGNACFDYSQYCFQGGKDRPVIRFTQKQRLLLKCLVEHANEGLSKEYLVKEVWRGQPASSNTVTHHLSMIRQHLSLNPEIGLIVSGQQVTLHADEVKLIRERSTF